jgi:hypothetical protein
VGCSGSCRWARSSRPCRIPGPRRASAFEHCHLSFSRV